MNYRVRPSLRTTEAEWIADRLAPFGSGVGAIVPEGFEAYVRILHPAIGRNGELIRWAEMAAKSGRTMHRLAQFHAINRESATGVNPAGNGPRNGNLPAVPLKALCGTLSLHTRTPESCRFCLWEGYGWLHDDDFGGSVSLRLLGTPGPQSHVSAIRTRFLNSFARQ